MRPSGRPNGRTWSLKAVSPFRVSIYGIFKGIKLNSIAERIAKLSELDQSRLIFGANGHGYRRLLIDPAALAAFESEIGCVLPVDYRQFLTKIGLGVGPYYGLLSFSKIREELQIIAEDYLDSCNSQAKPGDTFSLEDEILAIQAQGIHRFPPLRCPATPGGFIPICHHGCEYMTVLITVGACAGIVMDTTNFATTPSEWYPASCPPGVAGARRNRTLMVAFPRWPTFVDWIEGWLTESFFDLQGDLVQ